MNYNELFIPDFEAGTLTWKTRPREHFATLNSWATWNTRYAGKIAGSNNNQGYRVVAFNSKFHTLHRILFEMAHGPIPSGMQIDHIDGAKSNNAITNLRLATNSQNAMNKGARRDNKSGHKGVCLLACGKWQASIQVDGKQTYLGIFITAPEAAAAYTTAAAIRHGQFAKA